MSKVKLPIAEKGEERNGSEMAITERHLAEQLNNIPEFRKWKNKNETGFLPEILDPSEKVLAVTSALYREHKWLITVTDSRIIFLRRKFMEGIIDQISLEEIDSVSLKTGFLFGELLLASKKGKSLKITSVMKKDATLINDIIKREIADNQGQ